MKLMQTKFRRYKLYASGKTEARPTVFDSNSATNNLSRQAFMELYSQILDHGGEAFGAVLRHIHDRPTEGCLFHCTAGKDRTGLLAALLLKVRFIGQRFGVICS